MTIADLKRLRVAKVVPTRFERILRSGLVLAVASILGISAHCAELIVAGTYADTFAMRRVASGWENATGHRLTWLDSTTSDTSADIYLLAAHEARKKISAGEALVIRDRTEDDQRRLAPLLTAGFARDLPQEWDAMPLATDLPLMALDLRRLEARGLRIPDGNMRWPEIIQLAAQLTDPIGNVHGLCIAPQFQHATLLRAMLSDADLPWLDATSGEPFSGDNWQMVAENYARFIAQVGPANAAWFSEADFARLRKAKRCAMWLIPWRQAEEDSATLVMAVPGAAAFVAKSQRVLVLSASSPSAAAVDFAWWTASAQFTDLADNVGVRLLPPQPVIGSKEGALSAMFQQQGPRPPQLDLNWDDLDHRAQPPLNDLINGLIPADEALNKIQETLKEN